MGSPVHDVCVIGAGIIGLATAQAITERLPGASVVVVDKEEAPGSHQTGHNSGVLHSGLYYRPGSLKAALCAEGRRRMIDLCERRGLPLRISGKVVVATTAGELPALDELRRRGTANGLTGLRDLCPEDLTEIEPYAVGVAALHVPEAGVVDFAAVARSLARSVAAEVRLGHAVEAIVAGAGAVEVGTAAGAVRTRLVVNCAGLHADRVARLAGASPAVKIVPFRGEYHTLTPEAAELVRALVYPVPDPRFPFLGIHFTRRVDGTVEVGPNAVLALGREHYRGAAPDLGDVAETVTYPGFLRLSARYWRTGAAELRRSLSSRAYTAAAQRLVPGVRREDLVPAGVGVRAQAVTRRGELVDDFSIEESPGALHVLNAPSPGATASLAIGHHIARLVLARLGRD